MEEAPSVNTSSSRSCFDDEGDHGELFSLSEREARAAFGGYHYSYGAFRPWGSKFRNLQNQTHFLDSCFLCKRPLSRNSDIFMYRGDVPFCSEECREEQIERDEAKEKLWKLPSSSIKALRQKQKQRNKDSSASSTKTPVPTGPVVA